MITAIGTEDGSQSPLPDGMPTPPTKAIRDELKNTAVNLLRLILLHNDGNVVPARLQGLTGERILIVDGRQLTWEWVTNYYDTPLSGYARHDGKLYRVERVSEWGNWLNSDYDDDREDGPDNNPYNHSHDDNLEAAI